MIPLIFINKDESSFFHPHFIRDDPDQCKHIVRQSKGSENNGMQTSIRIASKPAHKGMQFTQAIPSAGSDRRQSALEGEFGILQRERSQSEISNIHHGLGSVKSDAGLKVAILPRREIAHEHDHLLGPESYSANLSSYNPFAQAAVEHNSIMSEAISMVPTNVNDVTLRWISSGAVSVSDLAIVLLSYNDASKINTDRSSVLSYAEDIISLFGAEYPHLHPQV